MDNISVQLRRLPSHHGSAGYDALQLIRTIVSNIVTNPAEPKYRSISTRSPRMKQALTMDETYEVLFGLGFKPCVQDMEERWVLQSCLPITLAKFQDILGDMDEYLQRYMYLKPSDSTNATSSKWKYILEKKHQQSEYWKKLTQEAEQDRLEKLEREERQLRQLKKQQEEKRQELSRKLREQRIAMAMKQRSCIESRSMDEKDNVNENNSDTPDKASPPPSPSSSL